MEEFVGKIWHRHISQSADMEFPEAAVQLSDIRQSTAIFFRALGGEGGLRLETSLETDNHARRNLLQRIAGTAKKNALAWRDEQTLRLPHQIALFEDKQLNLELYLWLTALSAIDDSSLETNNWLKSNQQRSQITLKLWPGMKASYSRLVTAHLAQRPAPEKLSTNEAAQETVIRLALQTPSALTEFNCAAKHVPQPVPLWLHPSPPEVATDDLPSSRGDPDHPDSSRQQKQQKQVKRKQGARTALSDKKAGLLSFRLESLWSWSEYIKLDRTGLDDDDDDAAQTAEDMDNISVTQDNDTSASKIKLDLDLPSSEYDDIFLGEGIPIDEWDYRQQTLQAAHCRLQRMRSRASDSPAFPDHLRAQASKIRRHFEILRPERHWVSRQTEGTELDLENYVHFLTDRKNGRVNADTPIYRELRKQSRDLSCLLLADLSLSTDAYINNQMRVIDVIRDALYLFSEALEATGDRFALHGFSSRNRNHVRFYDIKTFEDRYDDAAKGRINAVKPGYYTRMGCAIRYASQLLEQQASKQKLLLILTDGKPNDLDKYEGRYGIEDTRMAVLEAEKLGLRPFCVTIDEQAEDYLPYLFGQQSYALIRNAEELPRKLPLLYLRLTQ